MSYFITFENRKPEIFDNVKRFMLLNNIIILVFDNNSEKSLQYVIGIRPHYYNEG